VLTHVCQHLDLLSLVRLSETCARFCNGGPEGAELPSESPVVTVLREHAFPGGQPVSLMRPSGCSESRITHLARCARQRQYREAPPVAAGGRHTLLVDDAGRLWECGEQPVHALPGGCNPIPTAAVAGVRVRSVAAGTFHSLALGWNGRVYSWGAKPDDELCRRCTFDLASPVLVEGLEGVRDIAAGDGYSLAVTHFGSVFSWGIPEGAASLQGPTMVDGLEGVHVRRVYAKSSVSFAVSDDAELFSWGMSSSARLGHDDDEDQPKPKRVEALQGVRVSSVVAGCMHTLALTEDGVVYAWGQSVRRAVLGNRNVDVQLLPRPIEALQGVRVGSIAAADYSSYAVTDTGELWVWGVHSTLDSSAPLGHGMRAHCRVPRPIESFGRKGIKVDAVFAGECHVLALADHGVVYAWGGLDAARAGALGLGTSLSFEAPVSTPQRVPDARVALGL
jgi:E3 ubiquitin-protein ligase HERC2